MFTWFGQIVFPAITIDHRELPAQGFHQAAANAVNLHTRVQALLCSQLHCRGAVKRACQCAVACFELIKT